MAMQIESYKKNFFNGAVAEVLRAWDGGSIVGTFTLTFCLIDYMAWVEFKDGSNGFKKWIREYLIPINFMYTGKDQQLLSIRHGLIHSYGPSASIEFGNGKGYLLLKFDGMHMNYFNHGKVSLHIDIYYFFTEVVTGIHTAFKNFKKSITPEQQDRLQKQIFIYEKYLDEMFYSDMHPALNAFDNKEVNLDMLKAKFTERYI